MYFSFEFSLNYVFLFRIAKKKMDEQSFFGGLLHVCYAPEFETVEETRKKLEERKAYIARATKSKGTESPLLTLPVCHRGVPAQSWSLVT